MSARIDNLARAVTEPPVALAGGETAPERSEGDEGLPLFLTSPVGGKQGGISAEKRAFAIGKSPFFLLYFSRGLNYLVPKRFFIRALKNAILFYYPFWVFVERGRNLRRSSNRRRNRRSASPAFYSQSALLWE